MFTPELKTSSGFSRSNNSFVAEWWRTVDRLLLAVLLSLMLVGVLVSLAAGPAAATKLGIDQYHFVYRQSAFAMFAAAILVSCSVASATLVRRGSIILFLFAFVMMALVLLAGHEAKGAQRWIRMAGFTFQPSEFVKPALIVMVAWLLSLRRRGQWLVYEVAALSLFGATAGLLLLQPDVGQTILLSACFVIVFFVSGMSWRWFAGLSTTALVLGGLIYSFIPYVRMRVMTWLNPEAGDTYQIDKARAALERGGLLGAGIGEGEIKAALPDAHTDFVYAVIGEEYGLVVCFALILAFASVAMRGMLSASQHPDPFPRAAGVGLFALFGLQAAINISVNIALLPNKGMTLPLISYGGSSMLGSALTLGLALALTRRRPDFSIRRFAA